VIEVGAPNRDRYTFAMGIFEDVRQLEIQEDLAII